MAIKVYQENATHDINLEIWRVIVLLKKKSPRLTNCLSIRWYMHSPSMSSLCGVHLKLLHCLAFAYLKVLPSLIYEVQAIKSMFIFVSTKLC